MEVIEREALGRYLRSLMQARELTQIALADETGLGQTNISRALCGVTKRSPDYRQIAAHFGLSLEQALTRAEEFERTLEVGFNPATDDEPVEQVQEKRPIVIAIANEKGGVGKTTMAINLASGIARYHDKRVLLIDLDTQGSAADYLFEEHDSGHGLYELFESAFEQSIKVPSTISPESGVDFIAGGSKLSTLNQQSQGIPMLRLKRALEQEPFDHDVIILDTPPSLGTLTMNALVAADWVVIPTTTKPMSTSRIPSIMATIEQARMINANLRVLAIVPNFVESRQVVDRTELKDLRRGEWAHLITDTEIEKSVSIAEPFYFRRSIFEHDDDSDSAHRYSKLIKELWERIHE